MAFLLENLTTIAAYKLKKKEKEKERKRKGRDREKDKYKVLHCKEHIVVFKKKYVICN